MHCAAPAMWHATMPLLCKPRQHLGQGLQPIVAQQQLAQALQAEQLRDVAADLVPGRPLKGHLLQ